MQRIISMQTSRNADRQSSEFVTKRLCCSFLFSVAFLSLLGGFLLGRYATDKAAYLKSANLQRMQQKEEKHSNAFINNISKNINWIYDMTNQIDPNAGNINIQQLYTKLTCANFTVNIQDYESNLENHLGLKTRMIISSHLGALNSCLSNLVTYFNGTMQQPFVQD